MMRPYTTHWAAACLMLWAAAAPAQTQNALDFDGIDDEVTVANASAEIANSTEFSLACWVFPTQSANWPNMEAFAGFRDNAQADFYLLQTYGTTLEGRFRNSNNEVFTVNSTGLLTLNSWQFLAMTYDGSTLTLHRDNELIAEVPASGSITTNTGIFRIGNMPIPGSSQIFLDGQMDEVSLWRKALTAQDMECLMNSAPDPGDADLALYYSFDQGTAGGNNTTITALTDMTGSANGTLQGFALTGTTSNFVQGTGFGNTVQAYLCEGETYEFDGQELSEPGVYTATFPTGGACDSIVVLQLAVAEVDNGVVQNGSTMIATASEADYQWYSCGASGNTLIQGATAQYYQATTVGQYAVEVTQDGCSLLSECLTVTTIGIEEREVPLFTLSPIPAVDVLNVELTRPVREAQFTVLDMTGRALIQRNLGGARKLRLDVSDLPSGAYFLRMQADGEGRVRRFVRE